MIMDRKQFIDALFARAKEAGFEACEVYYTCSDSFSTDVFQGELIQYNVANALGLGFRGLLNGRMGYASTQILDADAIDLLVDGARENALLIESEDRQFLHPGNDSYVQLDTFHPELNDLPTAEKIAMARTLEQLTLEQDPRIAQVDGCSIASEDAEVCIQNTLGLNVSTRMNLIFGYVSPIAKEDDRVNSGLAYFLAQDPKQIDLASVAKRAASTALAGLNAQTVASGSTAVVLSPEAAQDLLQTFSGVFSAEVAQKGMSLLKGREGEQIASECVTILDDPHRAGGLASTPFDGEGVATSVKKVVDAGRLTTLLHNLKTAFKQGVSSTGNASRSYASAVSVAPTNFYFQPSDLSFDQMLTRLGEGLFITQLSGLHAGANAISGDFSLSAKGFRVRDGKIAEAVRQFTVAGNFYQLLKDIDAVGADLRFGIPSSSQFGSPSLLVRQLSVAGK